MIDFFFGKPRSGKTYRAMDFIYKEYIVNDNEPKFTNILTNIGGFKFDKVNEIFKHKGSKSVAYKLVWRSFHEHLKKLHEMALDDKSDDELNRYADYHKINDALIVLDEAGLFMKKYDEAISWWLAYHGHFRMRIIIIAQGPKQIYAEYMTHTEIFYVAQPQSKQLKDNSLRYIHYSDVPFNKDNKFSSNTIKTSQDVYALYKSGEVDKPKKIIYKFIGIALAALLLVVFLFYSLFHKLKDNIPDDENITNNSTSSNIDRSINRSFGSDEILISFRCDTSKCWLNDSKYKYFEISKSYLKYVLITNDIELSYFEVNNEIYKLKNLKRGQEKITIASLTDYYYIFPISVKNQYLSDLFQLKNPQPDTSLDISTPFSGSFSDDNGVQRQPPEAGAL